MLVRFWQFAIFVLNQLRSGYKKFWAEVLEFEELVDELRIKAKVDGALENAVKDGKEKLEAVRGVKEKFMSFAGDVEEFITVQESLTAGEVNLA